MATTDEPAPLDAYLTAKPGEPVFVLQGGDPLAAPLVALWAVMARVRSGRVPESALLGMDRTLIDVSTGCAIDNDREAAGLLIRATKAEEISWQMADYQAGRVDAEEPKSAPENSPKEKQQLDVYDLRKRLAARLSNFIGDLSELRTDLQALGYMPTLSPLDNQVTGLILACQSLGRNIDSGRHRLFDADQTSG